jgi:copper transport protein
VSAHASVAETAPTDGEVLEDRPETILIEFNEKVTTAEGSVRLIDSAGEATPLVEASRNDKGAGVVVTWQVPDDLEEGWHAVAWRAVSADGHPINGSFTFYYGDPENAAGAEKAGKVSDPTRPFILFSDLLRAVTYLTVLLAVGLLVVSWAFSGPALNEQLPGALAGLRRWSTGFTIVALVLTPLALVNNSIILNGGSTESLGVIVQIVLQSSAGAALLVRMSALFGLCTALLLLAEKGTRKVGYVIGGLSSIALLYSFPMAGHAAVVPWARVAEVSETLHLLAGAAWLGGIPAVGFVIARKRSLERTATMEVVERFSKIATVSVIAVLLAGVTAAVTMFTEPGDLVLTRYGVTLLVKFTLVGSIALLGAYNHFYLLPRLREDWDGHKRHLRTSLLSESFAILLVAVATSALTMVSAPAAGGNHLAGGHGHGGFGDSLELELALGDLEPRILRASVGDGEARLDYLPGRADAENRFTLTVTDASGTERTLERVTVDFTNEALELGPITRAFLWENGSWGLSTRDLGVAGNWTAKVTLSFEDGEMDVATFDVVIDPARSTEP